MEQIIEKLFVGTESDCFYDDREDWAVVHACKHPCHQHGVGYSGNLSSSHPNYLILEDENHLFLNMVDMTQKLMDKFTNPILTTALNFIDEKIESRNILIHCNQGHSRAPSIAMLYISKRNNTISNTSYQDAKNEFLKIYPGYTPGNGIELYLIDYWNHLE